MRRFLHFMSEIHSVDLTFQAERGLLSENTFSILFTKLPSYIYTYIQTNVLRSNRKFE